MARRSLAVWLVVLGVAVSRPTRAAEPVLENGDLVFESSMSRQAAAIRWASRSRWSHVGVVEVSGGRTAVIEAIGRVSRTPWAAFRRRAGRGGEILVLRPRDLDATARTAAVERARGFLGRPYDARFGWGDERLYCSELVVKAYERGAGVSLGRRERVGDLRLLGIEGQIRKRWGTVPRDLVLVAPGSLAEDPRLARVWQGR